MSLVESHRAITASSAAGADPPLSIALVSTQRGFRGGEMQLRLLAHGFRAAGQRAVLYARRGGPLAERLAGEGFEVRTFVGRGWSPAAAWRLRRHFSSDRPDVVYFNDSHALSGPGLAAWGLPIPLRVAARRVAFPIRSSWKYRHFCDAVLANCHATVSILADGGVPRPSIRVVHDGVPPLPPATLSRADSRRQLQIGDTAPMLLTVAALTAEKGHSILLDALAESIAAHTDIVWLCAGDGPLRPALEQQALRLGLTGRVRFLGQRSDIADLMAAADLMVLPSLCEGLCNAAIEAQYARLPLLVSNTGGLADVVGSDDPLGPTAWLAEAGDAASLAATIAQALASPERRSQLAQRGYERATRMFTIERMIAETLAMFRQLLQEAPRSSGAA